jgi:hypothetical protein
MNETVSQIWRDAGVEPSTETPPSFTALTESDSLASPFALLGLTAFMRFLRIPPDRGGKRASLEFWTTFLGHGQAVAEALLDRFAETMPETDPARDATLRAIVLGPRLAKAKGLIDWSCDLWKPKRERVERVGLYMTEEAAEAARAAAHATGDSLSGFVSSAVIAAASRLAETGTDLPVRARANRGPRARRASA